MKSQLFCAIKASSQLFLLLGLMIFSHIVSAELSDSEKGLLTFNQGLYEESYIHVKNALKNNPDDLAARILLAKLLVKNRLYAEAEKEILKVINAHADVNLLIDEWAETLLSLKQYKNLAELEYSKELSQPNQLKWNLYKSTACINLYDFPCSIRFYNQNLAIDDQHIASINGLAMVALIQKNYAEVRRYLTKALEISQNDAETWRIKGQLARAEGNINEAISFLNKAFELLPSDPTIARNLVDAYIANDKLEKAFTLSDKLIVDSPNDLYVQFTRNWLAIKTSSDNNALAEMQALANRLNGIPRNLIDEYPTFSYLRGTVSFLLGQYQSARDFLSDYHLRSGGELQSAYLLAKTYAALYDFDSALNIFQKYQEQVADDLSQSLFLGGLYLVNRKPHRAVALMERLESNYAHNIDYKLFAVQVAIARGKTQAALSELDTLIAANPYDKKVLIAHSMVNMESNQIAAAEKSLDMLNSLMPNDVDVQNLSTAMLIMQGKLEKASEALERVLSQEPDSYSALFNLATVQARLKRYPEALLTLERLLSINTDDIAVKLRLAKINLAMSKIDSASDLYQSVLKQDPNNLQAMEGLLQLNEMTGKYDVALRLAQNLQRLKPNFSLYVLKEAQVLIKKGDIGKASKVINQYASLIEQTPFELLALSQLYLAIDEKTKSLDTVKRAHELKPDDLSLHLQWITQLIAEQYIDDAQEQLAVLEKDYPNKSEVLLKIGELYDAKQQPLLAKQYYLRILKNDNSFELALARLYGQVANGLEPDDLLSVLNEIIKKHPDRYFPRSLLAQYHFYYGQIGEAIRQYEYLLSTENVPNMAALLNRLSVLYLSTNLRKSADYSSQAIALDNTDVNILSNHGWILAQQGQYEKSLTILRNAMTRNSSDPRLKYYLAFTLSKLKKDDQAKELLQELLTSKIEFAERAQATNLLQQIEARLKVSN